MPYRGVQKSRNQGQFDYMLSQVGETATLRKYVSASAGNPAAGFGSALSYQQMTITAFFSQNPVGANTEKQLPAGQLPAGQIRITTVQKLIRQDEILWRGIRYAVDSDSQPSTMDGRWMATLTRRNT